MPRLPLRPVATPSQGRATSQMRDRSWALSSARRQGRAGGIPMTLQVRKTAVLGAGVMGAQIAAHLANANVPVVLFDLPAKEGDPSSIAKKAIENLRKLEPSPLATNDKANYIDPANYDQHLGTLSGCDLVIEAISE